MGQCGGAFAIQSDVADIIFVDRKHDARAPAKSNIYLPFSVISLDHFGKFDLPVRRSRGRHFTLEYGWILHKTPEHIFYSDFI